MILSESMFHAMLKIEMYKKPHKICMFSHIVINS